MDAIIEIPEPEPAPAPPRWAPPDDNRVEVPGAGSGGPESPNDPAEGGDVAR